jgi:hypothetical protein
MARSDCSRRCRTCSCLRRIPSTGDRCGRALCATRAGCWTRWLGSMASLFSHDRITEMSRTDPRPNYGSYRRVRPDGYIAIYEPNHPLAQRDGYVAEHRKVAWECGILVNPSDHVHHLNGDKQDNRPENLEAVDASTHQREHHKAHGGWARENAQKTHCKHGHPLSGDNIYPSQLPARVCVTCNRNRAAKQYASRTPGLRP